MITELQKQRLNEFIEFLDSLSRKAFKFDSLVSKTNKDHTCGTVCCAAGWLPKFAPKSFEWVNVYGNMEVKGKNDYKSLGNDYEGLSLAIAKFFGITLPEVEDIFYNEDNFYKKSDYKVTKKDVLKALNDLKTKAI